MAGPQPITGMQRFRAVIQPEAPPESVHGGPSNPLHGHFGEQSQPYPWEEFAGPHGPYGPAENELLSDLPESQTFAAGNITQDPSGDQTPYHSHAGPMIKGMEMDRGPQGNARVLAQSAQAHAVRTRAALKGIQSSNPLQDHWNGFWNTVEGETILPEVGGQVAYQANGFGVNDRTSNPYHKTNPYGLNASHRMRRYAIGSIPGNYQWMKPGGRPMIKTLAGPSRPATGEGPFSGQDPTQSYGIQGVVLQDPATEYSAPPQPYVTPTTQGQMSAPAIELW
jgi:hypothetical protein